MNQTLLTDIRNLILSASRQVAQAVNKEIVSALRRQLGWTHFKSLIPIQDSLKRKIYAEMYRIEGTRLTLEDVAKS
ncbi:MAG: hypothetical protein HGJ93_17910 [Desulfosarcina sp.]|nr:hypothetical protein [Desulfosarcina sp.]MBC2767757.1 DUF1016 domain-containing protein [Desulfosarcina sp.]